MALPTPYYLIDERKLLRNLRRIEAVRDSCGARSLLALKCFASWAVFPLMRRYLDGTTSSSLYEVRLGSEKFGGETHAYCVGWSAEELRAARRYADKVIFNSIGQMERLGALVRGLPLGLRVNPGVSYSHFDLADPARRYSRLGVTDRRELERCAGRVSGLMFHCNCENDNLPAFQRLLARIGERYAALLKRMEWVSLGGGIYFTKDNYPLNEFCRTLTSFRARYGVQIYLEPGESAITRAAELVTTVVDIVRNELDIAIVDASTEAHMLDLLVYRQAARMNDAPGGPYTYMVAGRSCLAGDIFGTYRFRSPLRAGSRLRFADAAGYTIVKKNWFNGLRMPAIAVRRLDGRVEVVRRFTYRDYLRSLS